jgi:hypothetical protein
MPPPDLRSTGDPFERIEIPAKAATYGVSNAARGVLEQAAFPETIEESRDDHGAG